MGTELEKLKKPETYTNLEKEKPLENLEDITEKTINEIEEETAMSLKSNTELGNNFSGNKEIGEVINDSKSEILQNENKSQKNILERIRNNPKLRTLFYSLVLSTGLSFASEKTDAQPNTKPKIEQTHKHEKEITQENAKDNLKEVINKLYNINKNGAKILEGTNTDTDINDNMPVYYFGNFTLSGSNPKEKSKNKSEKSSSDRIYEVEFNRMAGTGELENAAITFHNKNNNEIELSFNEVLNGEIEYSNVSFAAVEGFKKMSVREYEAYASCVMASVKGDKNETPIWVDDKFNAKEIQEIITDFNENFKNYTPDGKTIEQK